MKDEIKEILDKFDKVLENYELDKKWGQMSTDSICHLFPSEMVAIKDYITNLQEENERLKDTMSKIKDLNTMQYLRDDIFKEHLNFILQGEDNTPENLYKYTPEKGFRLVGDDNE